MYSNNTPVKMEKTNKQIQMLVRMWSNRNSHSLLMRMHNGTTILKDNLAFFKKTEHILPIICTIKLFGIHTK